MSGYMVGLVFKHAPVDKIELLVLVAMADIGDDDGKNIYPSIPKLAAKTRTTERTVQRAIRSVETMRLLIPETRSTGRRGEFNRWRINERLLILCRPDYLAPEPVDPPEQAANKDGCQKVTRGRARVTATTSRVTAKGGTGDFDDTPIDNRPLTVLEKSAPDDARTLSGASSTALGAKNEGPENSPLWTRLRRTIDPDGKASAWLGPLVAEFDEVDGVLRLAARTGFSRGWVQTHYADRIERAASRLCGRAITVQLTNGPKEHAHAS